MPSIQSFAVAAGTWQNFYLLVGTAAATLVGLMFVAVTFGASVVKPETADTARSFLDPTFAHFVHVLFTACLMVIPSMGPKLLGALLLLVSALRTLRLRTIYRHMRAAHRRAGDIEASDWATGIAIPLICYLLLAVTGVGFVMGYAVAFELLAAVTIVTLMNGVLGAWELMVWIAITRAGAK